MLLGEFVSSISFLFHFIQNKIKMNSIQMKGDNGFGTVCKVDAGYYSQGFFFFFF